MKKQTSLKLAFAVTSLTGLVLAAQNVAAVIVDADQTEFPQITAQPLDQGVFEGSPTTFTVQATNGNLSFQWLRNGVALEGQTNSSLTLANVGINDVGLYSCNVSKDTETVPTRAASLNMLTALAGDQIVVFGTPIFGGGSQGTCPGPYAGYVNYTKTVAQGWGWAPTTGTTVHTASDGGGRADTKVLYMGKLADAGCAQTSVTIPDPTYSPKYRFTIYFTNNVPTNAYAITLSGFDP